MATRPLNDNVWSVSTTAPPLEVHSGIGWIVDRSDASDHSPGNFAMHDHQYSTSMPDATRSVVTYTFNAPIVLDKLDVIEHVNGVTAVHAFIGNNPGALTDLGEVTGSLGDRTFSDGEVNTFDFGGSASGTILQVEIARTELVGAFAFFRMYATTVDPVSHGASQLVVGDDSSGTAADDSANVLAGGIGSDHLVGLAENDRLNGGPGNDVTHGRSRIREHELYAHRWCADRDLLGQLPRGHCVHQSYR